MKQIGKYLAATVLVSASPLISAAEYTLFIYESPVELAKRTDPSPAGQVYWGAYAQFGEALKQAGVLRGGAPLQRAATAATVMARAGKEQSAVGQHGKAREELGGFFIIDVIDAEAAMKWARRAPAYDTGAVEVRASYAAPNMK